MSGKLLGCSRGNQIIVFLQRVASALAARVESFSPGLGDPLEEFLELGARIGLADNWIRHVADVAQKHAALLAACPEGGRSDRLCELNAIEQAENVCLTTVVQDAWARGQKLSVHGWVYSLHDGCVRELGMDVDSPGALEPAYRHALATLGAQRGEAP